MLTDAGGCDQGRWGVDWFVTVTRCLDRRCNGHMTRNMRESRIAGLEAIWTAWDNVWKKDLRCGTLVINARGLASTPRLGKSGYYSTSMVGMIGAEGQMTIHHSALKMKPTLIYRLSRFRS